MRAIPLPLAFALTALSAFPAAAQTWPICFQREMIPTSEAYRTINEASQIFGSEEPNRVEVTLVRHTGDDPAATALSVGRSREVSIELARAGFGLGRVRQQESDTLDLPDRCVQLTLTVHPPAPGPSRPPTLWHFDPVYYFSRGTLMDSDAGLYAVRLAATQGLDGRTRYHLTGHTDTVGSPDANMDLSRRRALAVAGLLVREGVSWDQIVIHARGETQLARPTGDEVSEPLNRRVVIYFSHRR